jgi:gamma-glutamylcyclotransferase (GGCT)/AIG2-like uncharacterized protein YtfP
MCHPSTVFIYGTLRRGGANHAEIADLPFLGTVRTAPRYRLVDCGRWPALVEGGDVAVVGELYEATAAQLHRLDLFEGVPHLYLRVDVELEDGTLAVSYGMPPNRVAGKADVPGGDWARVERL